MKYVDAGAKISPCGTYRYLLWRDWGEGLVRPCRRVATALWVCSNPSTADGNCDDPTVRRIVDFSKAIGTNRAEIVNWHAFRATRPADMRAAHNRGVDVYGPENTEAIEDAIARGPVAIVAAWGALPAFVPMPPPLVKLWETGAMTALGLNENGSPKHPRTVPKAAVDDGIPSVASLRGGRR